VNETESHSRYALQNRADNDEKDFHDCFNPVNPLSARLASSTRIGDKHRFSAIPHLHGLYVGKDYMNWLINRDFRPFMHGRTGKLSTEVVMV